MNRFITYLQRLTTSQTGRFATVAVCALGIIVVVRSCQSPKVSVEVSNLLHRDSTGEINRTNVAFKPPTPRAETPPKTNPPVLPAIRFGASNAPASILPRLALPARRLIPCKLVNTVDSSSLDTPIIGLVTQDVFWRGQLMVPAGTEVHGRAQAHHLRDRVGSQGAWVLVWAEGEELSVGGLALDMDQKDGHWGPTDASSGLRGTRERAGNPEELKLFVATFLAGITQAFQQRQNTILGSQVLPTVQNAALSGTGEVIESYAKGLLRTIEEESTFVRVPAGKAFYLYTLDLIASPLTNTVISLSSTP